MTSGKYLLGPAFNIELLPELVTKLIICFEIIWNYVFNLFKHSVLSSSFKFNLPLRKQSNQSYYALGSPRSQTAVLFLHHDPFMSLIQDNVCVRCVCICGVCMVWGVCACGLCVGWKQLSWKSLITCDKCWKQHVVKAIPAVCGRGCYSRLVKVS